MTEHHQRPTDIAHRLGIWTGMIALALYVMNIGQWVGAADEKFNAAATVETTQRVILLQQNTLAVEQKNMKEQLDDIKDQAETDKKEILEAIKEAHEDDE